MNRILRTSSLCLLLLVLTAPAGWAAGGSVGLHELQADDTGYVLTVGVTPTGAGTLNRGSGETFAAGQSVLMSCTANNEFVFDYWVADGVVVSRDSEFRFIMPDHDTSLTAVFHYAPDSPANPETSTPRYTLTLAAQPVNSAVPNRASGEQFAEDVMVYMSCSVMQDFVFSHWQTADSIVSSDRDFYFTMPAHDVTLTAVCRYSPGSPGNPETGRGRYTVTLATQPVNAGTFSWARQTVVDEDQQCVIRAYPNGDFTFREWQREGQTVCTTQGYSFVMPSEDVNLVAVYDYTPANPGNPSPNFFDPETGEVIIDDFTPGRLTDELFLVTGGISGNVLSLIVAGIANQNDWGVLNNCPSCATLDLGRTSGMTSVPSYNFNGNRELTTVVLPSSIESIGEYAFGGCPSLASLSIHAATPPVLGTGAFDGAGQLTVFVPAASLALYQQADGWKDFTILPLSDDVGSLTVNLPAGTDVSLYKDMYIEIINTQSGQKQRYVITDRTSYTFNSLIRGTSYNVYLRNAQDVVLGEIHDVEVAEDGVSVTFASLMVPRTLTLTVLTPAGVDCTDKVTVTWLDAKGKFITRGATLTNQMEGVTVRYSVALPQALAMEYMLPAEAEYTVQAANDITLTLEAIPQTTIGGTVADAKTSEPLAGAVVAVSQMLNGQYSKSFSTKTDGEGHWQTVVYEAATEITASMTGYVSQTQVFTAEELAGQDPLLPSIPAFELRDISGTTVLLTLTYTSNGGETQAGYPDLANVAYTVYDVTADTAVTDISVQYPKIVLMESVPEGTVLRVTATSKNQKFLPVEATAAVDNLDRALVTLPIKQLGAISATYGQAVNSTIAGILYDADGLLVKKYAYEDNSLTIAELPDGGYTLVTMASSQFFNSMGTIGQFAEAGLAEGDDYVKDDVIVSSGAVTAISNDEVPYLDERKLYFTGGGTKVGVNKSQVTAGQFVTVSANVDFKSAYEGRVDDVSLIFTIPAGAAFVDNSVMAGKSLATYTLDGNRLTVPLDDYSVQTRFCVVPTMEGSCEVSASVAFTLGGRDIVQPIGSAACSVMGMSISLTETTATPDFTVSGTAAAKSDVYVYADGIVAGRTKAGPSGRWNCICTLADPEDDSMHEVYAKVINPQGTELLSETKTLTYDEQAVLPQKVSMSFYNASYKKTIEVVYDLLAKTCSAASYMFFDTTDFTFLIDFTENNPGKVDDVKIVVFLNDNTTDVLKAAFNESIGRWVASKRYAMEALPTTVKVIFNGTGDLSDDGNAHCDPILDPSGYVYEGVSSNRLQGVTATAYYKEVVEDMYGDLHENIVLWDAAEYAQENPLFTDEYGMYQWDVPQGLWQVKFEKDGYQTVYSDWLPVPPPQLDVNIAMTQLRQPAVKSAKAYEDAVEVEFDKFMLPALLTTENIIVMAGDQPVEGTIELLNAESPEVSLAPEVPLAPDAPEAPDNTLASKIRFNAVQPFDFTEVTLLVSNRVESYAGIRMQDDYQQAFTVELEVRDLFCDSIVSLRYGSGTTIVVQAVPAAAAAGRMLTVESSSPVIISVDGAATAFDSEGRAEVSVSGAMPGTAALTFGIEGSDVNATTLVNVNTYPKGDINHDYAIDVADIGGIISVMAGSDSLPLYEADVNGDGAVDVADIATIITIMARAQ